MYRVRSTQAYRKAYKRVSKHKNFDSARLEEIIDTLASGEKLNARYQDHQLSGELQDYRECHVKGDLLLQYQIQNNILVLLLVDIGTHDDLFR
ncbi:MAG: type II toxin-antitoxin system YafQ family toxin [bacterium]|nr:type II toxin-antitoxin system YafQ family toxin [bacterium]